MNKTILSFLGAAAFVASSVAADNTLPPASDKKDVTYATDIKAILDKSCIRCHGADKPKAKLNLTTLETALKGGKDGAVIKPGNSAESPLVLSIAHLTKDHDGWMPPEHNKANIPALTADQIGLIRAWIDQGAK